MDALLTAATLPSAALTAPAPNSSDIAQTAQNPAQAAKIAAYSPFMYANLSAALLQQQQQAVAATQACATSQSTAQSAVAPGGDSAAAAAAAAAAATAQYMLAQPQMVSVCVCQHKRTQAVRLWRKRGCLFFRERELRFAN